ncbi:hypothetical protein ACFO5Q_15500 [Kordiimonas lipolytica]|uniref:Uncharacterized protein n=1 Tax=Kordiimonas lipolytica TaxID=1662421 RepID=A0ABV8UEX7_9PROT|nr:hypothetical protein [Kordiimonas lipolytica]
MKPHYFLAAAMAAPLAAPAASAHIDLISPTPLQDGHAYDGNALKAAPFGAPDVDGMTAPSHTVEAGSVIDVEVNVYKLHPGEIVISYTRDLTGEDAYPVYEIASIKTPIPHTNVLLQAAAPCSNSVGCTTGAPADEPFRAKVKLPDIEGDIMLIARQVMRDKMIVNDDGSVDLSEVYYHQAAKLHLVRTDAGQQSQHSE